MAMNAQHKRVSKNRVSITYDVETKEDALIESSTHAPIVNPFGVITINNMNEFADLFSEADKLKIATMIENGEVNYLCQ